jgi:hypothetical protein
MAVDLMPHQKDAIKNLANGKILWGGVGTGKSLTVLGYYMEKEAPRDIYIITTAKKRDSLEWEGDAAKYGIGTRPGATLAGVLHIDSWNNISKYTNVEDAFFIFDEQRLVGSGAWVKSFQRIAKRNRWVLLSATPGDTWLDYVPVFVANGLYRNATQFKLEHVVYAPYSRYPKIIRFVRTDILEKWRNMLLVEMPYMMHTTRHVEKIVVKHDAQLFSKVVKDRWNPYEDAPIQDVAELFVVMRKVVNSDASRLQAVRSLMQKHDRLIVFYNFNYELDILRQLGGSGVSIAEWNGHKHETIPETDKWVYLVQYVAGAEGWNCTSTDAMCFYSLTYSYKNFMQAQGRIDRLNTPFTDLYYYVLMSTSAIDRAVHLSLSGKKMFNESKWAKEHGFY